MKSNISIAFEKCRKEKRPALITYTVGGDNTKKKSLDILNAYLAFKFKNSFFDIIFIIYVNNNLTF